MLIEVNFFSNRWKSSEVFWFTVPSYACKACKRLNFGPYVGHIWSTYTSWRKLKSVSKESLTLNKLLCSILQAPSIRLRFAYEGSFYQHWRYLSSYYPAFICYVQKETHFSPLQPSWRVKESSILLLFIAASAFL